MVLLQRYMVLKAIFYHNFFMQGFKDALNETSVKSTLFKGKRYTLALSINHIGFEIFTV